MKMFLLVLALVAAVNAEQASQSSVEGAQGARRGLLWATPSICWSDSSCSPGFYCNTWATCSRCYDVGATCSRHAQCGSGWCNQNTWVCGNQPTPLPLLPVGATCTSNGQCTTGLCVGNKCSSFRPVPLPQPQPLPLLPAGAQCTTNGQCSSGKCDICVGAAYGYCADSCSWYWWCSGGLSCSSGFCSRSCFTPLPVPLPTPIPTCNWALPWGAACSSDCQCACRQCWRGQCQIPPAPTPGPNCGVNYPIFAVCRSDCECAVGWCNQGRCENRPGQWPQPWPQQCSSANSCPSGHFCQWTSGGSSCVPKRGAGATCGADWECLSGSCSSGRCSNSCWGLWCGK